ncbi:MAG: response regulator, partial [Proteobacteria bacterium]
SPIVTSDKPLQGANILIVDDAPDNQLLFNRILTKLGAKTESAKDGFEGMEMALSDQFDIILMDIQMPRMDGHEATRSLRERGYTKPIIALTAHAMVEERQRAMHVGFDGFLSKPLRQIEMLELLLTLR